ncbi:MAG: AAA family ATPase [Cyanobacteria bacterium]|jgi:ATP-dependent 26S proteasome regulatory subunit|nr:AAA family ATPase [Cyanobacteria bacterium GSL.Bin21]
MNLKPILKYKPVALSAPSVEEMNVLEQIAEDWINTQADKNFTIRVWDQADGWQLLLANQGGIQLIPYYRFCQLSEERQEELLEGLGLNPELKEQVEQPEQEEYQAMEALSIMEEEELDTDERRLYIFLDIHPYLSGNYKDPVLIRKMKNTINGIKGDYKTLMVLGGQIDLPLELQGYLEEVRYSLPNRDRIEQTINECFADLEDNNAIIEMDEENRNRLTRVCQGLTVAEIRDALYLAYTTSTERKIDNRLCDQVNETKIKKLEKLNVKFSPAPDVEVGGLNELKRWIKTRSRLFQAQDDNLNLPCPKGMMLVGIPGTGKSLIAKTIGKMWSAPILSVNFGDLYNSLVGETEKNLNQLLSTAEAIAPCILFVDELEKALTGVTNGGSDSGVSERIFGTFLTWMQEKTKPVFVVATANDISALPPELTRKGRFDEIFFVDLPNLDERTEILSNHLQHPAISTPLSSGEVKKLASEANEFSGAELGSLVNETLLLTFDENRYGKITYDDLAGELTKITPLASRYKEQITHLRNWAKESARHASNNVEGVKLTAKRGKLKNSRVKLNS